VSDGHIIKDDGELLSSLGEDGSDLMAHFVSLNQELFGIILGHNRLEGLLANRRNDSLVVVSSNLVEDPGDVVLNWSVKKSQ
jgi:hypothetical protein